MRLLKRFAFVAVLLLAFTAEGWATIITVFCGAAPSYIYVNARFLHLLSPSGPATPVAVVPQGTRSSPAAGARSLVANNFAGADLGAKINAAFAALGSEKGTVHVYGGGSITSYINVGEGCTLWFHDGTYTHDAPFNTVPQQQQAELGLIRYKNGSTVRGDGRGTILVESTYLNHGTILAPYAGSILTNGYHHTGVTRRATLRDLQLKGRVTKASNGTASTVDLGNCHDCLVENLFLNQTTANGITVGGLSYESTLDGCDVGVKSNQCASGVIVRNNYLFQVQNQGLNVVNGQHVQITNNLIKDHNRLSGSNGTGIDLETNANSDTLKDITIEGNTLDFRNSPQPSAGNGINIQSSGQKNYGPVVVKNNTLIGDDLTATAAGHMVYGIIVTAGTKHVTIVNNTIQRTSNSGIAAYGTHHVIEGNKLISVSRAADNAAINLIGATNCVVKNNTIKTGLVALGDNGRIAETSGANSNIFEANISANAPTLAGAASKLISHITQ